MVDSGLARLIQYIQEAGFAAVAVNAGPTLSYLTGLHFHLSERPVVMVFATDNEPVIVLPELEQAKLDSLPFPARVYAYGENPDSWGGTFAAALGGLGLAGRRLGVEPRQLRLLEYEYVRSAFFPHCRRRTKRCQSPCPTFSPASGPR